MGEASLEVKVPSELQAKLDLEASIKDSKTKPLGVSEKDVAVELVKKKRAPQPLSSETHWEEDGEEKLKFPEGLDGEAFKSQTLGNIGRKIE